MSRTILLTGGAGFIGLHTAVELFGTEEKDDLSYFINLPKIPPTESTIGSVMV